MKEEWNFLKNKFTYVSLSPPPENKSTHWYWMVFNASGWRKGIWSDFLREYRSLGNQIKARSGIRVHIHILHIYIYSGYYSHLTTVIWLGKQSAKCCLPPHPMLHGYNWAPVIETKRAVCTHTAGPSPGWGGRAGQHAIVMAVRRPAGLQINSSNQNK